MLVSDLIEIPHEKLADWIALIGAAIVYLVFAIIVFYGLHIFVSRTRMKILGNLFAALVLAAGLIGYFELFVALDAVTFGRAVTSALSQTPARSNDALFKRLSEERARSIRGPFGPIDLRRIGFYLLPVVAAGVAAMTVRTKTT
ncbi:MAG TPA: hypothetical protein VII32_02905 [Thermoanaerobaculia bacterium]